MHEHVAAREQWADGARRLEEAAADPVRYERLLAQVEAVTEELRRRVGRMFTLGELAEAYAEADVWSREIVAERAPVPGWPRDVAIAQDAAFHAYARSARDFAP